MTLHVRRHLRGLIGGGVLALVLGAALLAPVLAPIDPLRDDLAARLRPPTWSMQLAAGTLGTDQLGRDVLSRLLHGARISLVVGLGAVVLSALAGSLVGLLAGMSRAQVDLLVMRLVDLQMAFPFLVLAIAVMSVLVPSLRNVVIVLALSSWVVYARLVRARTLQILTREHVVAARALGCSAARLVGRHIVPNLVPSILIVAAVQLGQMVVAESSLSYLGLGVQPPTPTWGGMISEGREYIARAWWIITFPGLSLVLTVLGISFLGEWLRDVMDPTLNMGRL